MAFLRDQSAFNEEALPVLKKERDFWKSIRTTKETTYLEMCENHPVIHEEVENELEARDWFSNTDFDKTKQD